VKRFIAAVGYGDRAADLGQPSTDEGGDLLFIISDEHVHGAGTFGRSGCGNEFGV
jgi:hypothetical protein